MKPVKPLEGPLGAWGRTLRDRPPGREEHAIAVPALLTGPTLRRMLVSYGRSLGTDTLPVAASAWSKIHAKVVLPGVIGTWIVHDIGPDSAPENTHLHLVGHRPVGVRILDPHRGEKGTIGRDLLLESLFIRHLEPLYRRIHYETGLGLEILWGNAGNLITWLLDRFSEQMPQDGRIHALRRILIEEPVPEWAKGKNPILDPVRYETIDSQTGSRKVQVRRTCCLRHALPECRPCTTCPLLDAEERKSLLQRLERGP